MNTQSTPTMNGLNVDQMTQTLDALRGDPTLAAFEFRATNRWVNGGENRSTIQSFYGAGQEDTSREEPFVFTNGEPPVLLGNNEGANPVEFLLHALAGCVTTTTVTHATARGIPIRSIATTLRGTIDLQGMLALDPDVQAGYQGITIDMEIDADCSDEEIEALLETARGHSPVCTTVCRPVPVKLNRVQRQQAAA
ncbi:OsmC family protein [Halofilum ochraceum]|uniref:OsmC family protein n=1 Tax=Halofilum ochraceum TaxID=1611323 RepID=UPI0008DA8574